MKVVIRADASVQIGSGHIMRCLTLAELLRGQGASVTFICRELSGNLNSIIHSRGFHVISLPEESLGQHKDMLDFIDKIKACHKKIDLIIVDHYELGADWENGVRLYTKTIMAIDDLADRAHDCDILLDQNYYPDMFIRYQGLVPANCRMLLGPRYILFRPEFIEARRKLKKPREGKIKKILITFGGSDITNETIKSLQAIEMLDEPEIMIDVVVGSQFAYKEEVEKICAKMPNTAYHCQVENMAELISNADLAIGAGGSTAWERCLLGLPAVTVVIADNQEQVLISLEEKGALINLGRSDKVSAELLREKIRELIDCPLKLRNMSENALKLMEHLPNENEFAVIRTILEVVRCQE